MGYQEFIKSTYTFVSAVVGSFCGFRAMRACDNIGYAFCDEYMMCACEEGWKDDGYGACTFIDIAAHPWMG